MNNPWVEVGSNGLCVNFAEISYFRLQAERIYFTSFREFSRPLEVKFENAEEAQKEFIYLSNQLRRRGSSSSV